MLGCYTSASRQSVLPVFEEFNGLLLYPTLYEAQECSKNCFYTGAVPNQQLDDFVPWIISELGRKKCYMTFLRMTGLMREGPHGRCAA